MLVVGGFLAQNFAVCPVLWLELIPFYLLIAIWGNKPPWLCSYEISHLYGSFWNFNSGSILGVNRA